MVYKRVGEIGNSVHTMASSAKLTYGEGVIIRKLEEVRRTVSHSEALATRIAGLERVAHANMVRLQNIQMQQKDHKLNTMLWVVMLIGLLCYKAML